MKSWKLRIKRIFFFYLKWFDVNLPSTIMTTSAFFHDIAFSDLNLFHVIITCFALKQPYQTFTIFLLFYQFFYSKKNSVHSFSYIQKYPMENVKTKYACFYFYILYCTIQQYFFVHMDACTHGSVFIGVIIIVLFLYNCLCFVLFCN